MNNNSVSSDLIPYQVYQSDLQYNTSKANGNANQPPAKAHPGFQQNYFPSIQNDGELPQMYPIQSGPFDPNNIGDYASVTPPQRNYPQHSGNMASGK